MAAGVPFSELWEEASCSICLGYFRDPVTIPECGHNFCRACLTRSWGESGASCPQCGETAQPGNLQPNRQLANIVGIVQRLSLLEERRGEAKGVEEKRRLCEKHREPLKLFCQNDKALICVVCDRSREHKGHEVLPLEEASQEYKDKFLTHLEILSKEKEKRTVYKADAEKEIQYLFEQTESERQKMVAEFRQLHQFLEEKEKVLLTQMEELEKEIARERDGHLARLSRDLSSLENLILEMEKKIEQPASDLLQDVRSALQRCEEKFEEILESPVALPLELKWKTQDVCDLNFFLKAVTKPFQDTLVSGLQLQKANMTLDPDTAHPHLVLPADCTSVREGDDAQDLPDNPERFDQFAAVLGHKGFASGRHFWDVTVARELGWAVGIARKSVRRKGAIEFSPEEGIWAVEKWLGGYSVFINPHYELLTVSGDLRRIRISLNYHAGRVAFFDADTAAPLYIFSGASFSGETLFPFFWVRLKAQLDLST
ncbi:PREDICTED: tripartite motif-containing protein 7-like [Gekko japonicus]|uniref:RING-type E3 ubiquitin transferase n=1 Tax=Gekko japonicus TaxID=146911 RepID=A0ABM1JKM1_GEKJA|nr:PREDICTED: tripartite motif-containing protein 7-like [Gekko japonicus]